MNGNDTINFEMTEDEHRAAIDYDAAEMAYYRQMEDYIEEYADRPDCPFCEYPVTTRHGEPYCDNCEMIWLGGWPQLADERRTNTRHDIEADRRHENGVAR